MFCVESESVVKKLLPLNAHAMKEIGEKIQLTNEISFIVSEMLSAMRHHTRLLLISIALFDVIALSLAQRVAPGVPPQQYVSEIL